MGQQVSFAGREVRLNQRAMADVGRHFKFAKNCVDHGEVALAHPYEVTRHLLIVATIADQKFAHDVDLRATQQAKLYLQIFASANAATGIVRVETADCESEIASDQKIASVAKGVPHQLLVEEIAAFRRRWPVVEHAIMSINHAIKRVTATPFVVVAMRS